jgi:hypothetical protein
MGILSTVQNREHTYEPTDPALLERRISPTQVKSDFLLHEHDGHAQKSSDFGNPQSLSSFCSLRQRMIASKIVPCLQQPFRFAEV